MRSIVSRLQQQPLLLALVGTLIGYTLVIGTFLDLLPIYPSITLETSTMLSHTIAIVNAATIGSLLIGWFWIRKGEIRHHRRAMLLGFSLIIVFLVLYLLRIGGGGTKEFVGHSPVREAYLLMLGVHILLSVLAVPLVLYVLALGLTRSPEQLRSSPHARIGRIAVTAWLLSLFLGLVTYVMLEHLYSWEYAAMVLPVMW